tara:strand:- start:7164 stop:7388 length:225 start_codon:yes stop_codon:yes gene_type:complete
MERLNSLISKINSLDLTTEQYIEIYKIIKKNDNVKITKNNNGAFINLTNISEETINDLENHVEYIKSNDILQNK